MGRKASLDLRIDVAWHVCTANVMSFLLTRSPASGVARRHVDATLPDRCCSAVVSTNVGAASRLPLHFAA